MVRKRSDPGRSQKKVDVYRGNSNKPLLISLVVVMLFVVGGVYALTISNQTSQNNTGDDFVFTSVDGDQIHLSDYRGKVVILDMWAIQCTYCQYQLIELKKIYDHYSRDELEIFSVDVSSETIQQIQDFREQFKSQGMDLNWIFQKIGFKHHGLAIWWDETISHLTTWGSWLSASAPYINSPLEGILILYKNIWKKQKKGQSTINRDLFVNLTKGIWKVPPERRNSHHPSPFPVKLVENAINLLTFEKEIVLDPFFGWGTTAVACEKTNRRWIGIEISEKYCEAAWERILKRDRRQLTID